VLQVTPGAYVAAGFAAPQPQLTLHLLDETTAAELVCILRQEWASMRVAPGAVVHVTGSFSGSLPTCIVDDANNIIVVRPCHNMHPKSAGA
jgi:hypothetical protein